MRKIIILFLLALPASLIAQNPLAKEKWQNVIAKTNFSNELGKVQQTLKSGYWFEGLLVYKDGTAKETNINITSLPHISMPNGRIKTTDLGEVNKKDLSYFIIDQYLWMNKAEKWGVVQVKGPMSLFVTFNSEDESTTTHIIDEQGKWASQEEIEAGFRKKMKGLLADYAPLAKKINDKAEGYRSVTNLSTILNEYNEWIRTNDPDRYRQALQFLANK